MHNNRLRLHSQRRDLRPSRRLPLTLLVLMRWKQRWQLEKPR